MPRLENWTYVLDRDNKVRVVGNIFDDPKFVDSTRVRTSAVVGQRNGLMITESGTAYELSVNNSSISTFRDAVLDTLQEV